MKINVEINPVYEVWLDKKQKTQIFFGGSSSGKSFFICQKIVLDCLDGANWLVCRNVARTIRNSTYNQIVKTIYDMELGKFFKVNKSDMVITCLHNNKQILFNGLDDVEKVKSITPANGVLERIFIEEATEIKEDAYMQLTKRLRGISDKEKYIVMAFNPILQSHWIYKKFFAGKWSDDSNYYEDKDICILKTTYKDNCMLTAEDRKRLENESDPYYYNVYSLGNWGVLGSIIFKNWHTADLSKEKSSFDNIYNGLDFGYSNDPTALIRVHIDRKHKRMYVFDELVKKEMQNEEIGRAVKERIGNQLVICDCAEPKAIAYLNQVGVKAVPCTKSANSINFGIRWMQGYEIIIDKDCVNARREFETYHWLEDKNGIAIDKPCDRDNHTIDAIRYATEPLQRNEGVFDKRKQDKNRLNQIKF